MNAGGDPTRVYHHLSSKLAVDAFQAQILSAELKQLDVSNVVTFASDLVQQDIPKIPDGLLRFEESRLYSYPSAGLSFTGDLLFFGKRANIKCSTYAYL